MERLVAGNLLSLSFAALLGPGSAIHCRDESYYSNFGTESNVGINCGDRNTYCHQALTAKRVIRGCGHCSSDKNIKSLENCTDCLSDLCNNEQYSAAPLKFQCVEHDPGHVNKKVPKNINCSEAVCKRVVTATNVKRGCGRCSPGEQYCEQCTANLCNAVKPRIRCFKEDSANKTMGQRTQKTCAIGVTHCKQILTEARTVRDCGACSDELGCTDCLFDLCNEQEYSSDSKPLTCVEEATGDATPNKARTDTQCKPNVKCMQLFTDKKVKRGCGDCSAEANADKPNCLTCNSQFCNDVKLRLRCYEEDTSNNRKKMPKICPAQADTHCKRLLTADAKVKRDCGGCEEKDGKYCEACNWNLCNDDEYLKCIVQIQDTANAGRNSARTESYCEANVAHCKQILTATLTERGCGRCVKEKDGDNCTDCMGDRCNNAGSKITTTTPTTTPQGTTTAPNSGAVVHARPTLAVLLAALTCLATLL